ncbi:MAG: VWA domain-containing protein [Cocleimonas sp.]
MIEFSLNFLQSIDWQRPYWLLLMLQPLLLWLIMRWLRSRNQQNYADKHLLPWVCVNNSKSLRQKIFSRDSAYVLAWVGFTLALAGARVPDTKYSGSSNVKLDVMLVMDLSRSMYATDIKPSRLRRAVLEAYEFLSLAKSLRVGIVVYAARTHLYVPLTNDLHALKFYLKDLDSMVLPTQGSDSVGALHFAQRELNKSKSNTKSIIWITDGDVDEKQLEPLQQLIIDSSITIHSLGIAANEGASIPLLDGTWLNDKGQGVITTTKFDQLTQFIKKGGGAISIVSDDESDWENIYQGLLKDMKVTQESQLEHWKPLYMWFLLPAMVLFFIAYFPSFRAALVLIILSSFIAYSSVSADEAYVETLKKGEVVYQTENYEQAKSIFIQAVLQAKTENERAMALHNLGNTLFQIGNYKAATTLFEDALRYNAGQNGSVQNKELSHELHAIILKRRSALSLPGRGDGQLNNGMLLDAGQQSPSSSKVITTAMTDVKLPEIPEVDLNRLLAKGLSRIELLEGNEQERQARLEEKKELDNARLYMLTLSEQTESNTNPLWKRMFEIEEGFAASLKVPEKVPGIKSW